MDPTWVAVAGIVAGPIGIVIGWVLNERSASARWRREQSTRWHAERMDVYSRFLAAFHGRALLYHRADTEATGVELDRLLARIEILAGSELLLAAHAVRHVLRAADSPYRGDDNPWSQDLVLVGSAYTAAVRRELGLPTDDWPSEVDVRKRAEALIARSEAAIDADVERELADADAELDAAARDED